MTSEKSKTILVPSPDGSKMIELTAEEVREYTECVEKRRFTNHLISVVGGIFAAMSLKVQAKTPISYYAKKGLTATVAMTVLSVFTEMGSVLSCAPLLQNVVKSKMDNSPGFPTPVGEKDEPSAIEQLDFTPNISSHDFSSPINFSSDASGTYRISDNLESSQELGGKAAAGKKRVTYDDLWRLHKENSQERNKAGYSSEGTELERTEENEPSWGKKKVRTNKYGDPLE